MGSASLNHETFRELTGVLLDPDSTPGDTFTAANRLHVLLDEATRISAADDAKEPTHLPTGTALSPVDAGRCLLDLARTRAYLLGLTAAIEDLRTRCGDRPVHVLYAGCGPFATLALPLTTRFAPDTLRFTLLDVHAASIQSVQRLVDQLELAPYVQHMVQADAAAWTAPANPVVDILLVETMQRALTNEPQVAVTRNLLRQLSDDTVLVPARITLRACLANPSAEVDPADPRRDRVELGTLFELSAATARAADAFKPTTVTLPRAPAAGEHLVIATAVEVHGNHALGDYDSGITFPHIVTDTPPLEAGIRLAFTYDQNLPGLRVDRAHTA
ncbi:MAG: hypothetical protein QNJ98_00180 [Planctomycetota bacterium]|nr:hypothetical protein [Planctomycetota bacterium]